VRKQKRCTKTLTLNVSDDMEVIAEGVHPFFQPYQISLLLDCKMLFSLWYCLLCNRNLQLFLQY